MYVAIDAVVFFLLRIKGYHSKEYQRFFFNSKQKKNYFFIKLSTPLKNPIKINSEFLLGN